jgi:phage-related baseplate assembly protein
MSIIDLTGLPPPSLLETPDAEAYLASLKADFVREWDAIRGDRPAIDVLTLDHEPVTGLLRVAAECRRFMTGRINDAARAMLIAYATGADLDHVGALFGVARMVMTPATSGAPAIMEDDTRFKRRIQLAPDAFSSGGPRGAYIFHGLSIDPGVYDCWAWKLAPGQVEVVLAGPNGADVSNDIVAKLVDHFAHDDKVPLTDAVSVVRAQRLDYTVAATLFLSRGPDPALVAATSEAALRRYAASRFRIARPVYASGLNAALTSTGIETVIRLSPPGDVLVSDREIAVLTAVDLETEIE